jgi:hypothetical protein
MTEKLRGQLTLVQKVRKSADAAAKRANSDVGAVGDVGGPGDYSFFGYILPRSSV